MQAVGQLDQHDADVLGHGQEHLAHVLGPQVLAVQRRASPRLIALDVEELHLVELGDAVDQARDLATEAASSSAIGTPQSSDTSCSSAATIVAVSSWSSASVSATASGWLMYGSPDSRTCGACASAANA